MNEKFDIDQQLAAYIAETATKRKEYWQLIDVSVDYVADLVNNDEIADKPEVLAAVRAITEVSSWAVGEAVGYYPPLSHLRRSGHGDLISGCDFEELAELAEDIRAATGAMIIEVDQTHSDNAALLKLAGIINARIGAPANP